MKSIFSKFKKLPRAARKGLQPRKEFLDHGKERFLAAFDASGMGAARGAQANVPYVALFFKFAIGAAAAFFVFAGFSAYADTTNVPASNPLYPLKRLSENVRLALAPAPEKAKIQASLAVRRAAEIDELKVSAPSSTLIPALTEDLDEDIGGSLSVGVNGGGDEGRAARGTRGNGSGGDGNNGSGALPPITVTATTTVNASGSAGVLGASEDSENTNDAFSKSERENEIKKAIGVYCKALDVSSSGVLLRHLERFNVQCGGGNEGNGAGDGNAPGAPGAFMQTTTATTTAAAATSAASGNGGTIIVPPAGNDSGGNGSGENGGGGSEGGGVNGRVRGSIDL